jgi:hypothetical protein
MRPSIRCDLAPFGQPDHVGSRGGLGRPAENTALCRRQAVQEADRAEATRREKIGKTMQQTVRSHVHTRAIVCWIEPNASGLDEGELFDRGLYCHGRVALVYRVDRNQDLPDGLE